MSVSAFVGYLKGKSSLMIYEQWGISNSNTEIESFGVRATMSIQ